MSSFYADPGVGGDGSTTTDDSDPSTGLANGGFWTRLVPMFTNVVAIANYAKTKATEALGYKSDSSSYATAAGLSATAAASSATNSSSSAATASTQAGIATTQASLATAAAASLVMPVMATGDAGKVVTVNSTNSAYILQAPAPTAGTLIYLANNFGAL